MKIRGMYEDRPRVTSAVGGVTRTKQAFAEECDVNRIMRRYVKTGELPVGGRVASYGDFSGPAELLEARALIVRAEAQFAALPATVREKFKNDPAAFLMFVQNPDNRPEMKKLGLLVEEEKPSKELQELKRIADTVAERLAPAPVAK